MHKYDYKEYARLHSWLDPNFYDCAEFNFFYTLNNKNPNSIIYRHTKEVVVDGYRILKNNDVLEKINKHNAKLLRSGKHVVIKITKIQYKDKMPHIRVEGFLERVATESETNEMIKIGEETDMDYVKYTDYENKYKKIVEYDAGLESDISSSDDSDIVSSSGDDEIISDDDDDDED